MQEVFKGKVYDMIKKPDGVVFSYLEEVVNEGVLVKFKMIDASTGIVKDIAKNVYLLAKFGSNYKPAVKLASNYITVKAINLPSGKSFLCEKDGGCILLDSDGSVIWTGSILYKDNPPSDIALYDNCVWASFIEDNVLIRFNLATMREELRIGGKSSPFFKPRGIFVEGNTAIVSNIGSKCLVKVNLDTYSVEPYYDFDEGVRAYTKAGDYEFVLLQDGIYYF